MLWVRCKRLCKECLTEVYFGPCFKILAVETAQIPWFLLHSPRCSVFSSLHAEGCWQDCGSPHSAVLAQDVLCSVPKLLLQPAFKHLASVCFSNHTQKMSERDFRENESQVLLLLSFSIFIGLLWGVSLCVHNPWGSCPNNWTELSSA